MAIVDFLIKRIKEGKLTLEEIPSRYYQDVKNKLEKV